ncbi:MAG: hypothetical protein WC806_00535 [Candidatus Gracilibacteria bacterium]|jgi:hypothetical protein
MAKINNEEKFAGMPKIIFYCKDCEQIVDTFRVGGKYVYKCKQCGTKNVAFGTPKSIYGFFHIRDDEPEKEPVAKESVVKEGAAK